jgi:hypothetical protein
LSTIAGSYQAYRFKGLLIEFCSRSADALNSTNTALGTVILATNYNVLRPNFASKQEMEASEFCSSSKPSMSVIHPIECAPGEAPLEHLYVRTAVVPAGQDARFYDLGNFQFASVGMQASAVIGEIWVTYDVELIKPRLPSQIPGAAAFTWAYRVSSTGSNADPFNTGGLVINTVGGLGCTVSNLVVTFPSSISSGSYLMSAYWIGASSACSTASPVLSNCSLNTQYWNSQGYTAVPTTTGTRFEFSYAVTISGFSSVGSTLTLSGLNIPTSCTLSELFIIPIPSIPNSSPY